MDRSVAGGWQPDGRRRSYRRRRASPDQALPRAWQPALTKLTNSASGISKATIFEDFVHSGIGVETTHAATHFVRMCIGNDPRCKGVGIAVIALR